MPAPPSASFAQRRREGKLAFTVAADGTPVFPPRAGLEWRESAGWGTVYATTTVRRRDEDPYDVSLVELDEGFRMMSRVEGVAPEDVTPGLRVRAEFIDGADGPYPIFRPREAASEAMASAGEPGSAQREAG